MRATIVFPVALCIPNQLYLALPMLAAALRRGGHRARAVDLNVRAADLLCDRARAERLLTKIRRDVAACPDAEVAGAMSRTIDANEALVLGAQECKDLLRSPRFFEAGEFKRAFWSIVDVLGFHYQMDPVISPFRAEFPADVQAHDRTAGWTPVADLYDEGLLDAVLEGSPEMVGICVAFPEQAYESIRLARRVRERSPGTHICFGGPLVALHSEKWLRDGWIFRYADSVCLSDGETAIVELADALEGRGSLEDVRNFAFLRSDGSISRPAELHLEAMDGLPVPDFDAVDMSLYFTPKPIYPLMMSRGCYWGRCKFCSIGWRENFRMASPKKIREDAVDLARRHGARYVRVEDSSLPPKAARVLAQIVREEKLGFGWVGSLKFDKVCLDRAYLAELHAGGCRSLIMGLETMNQSVIDLMDKGFEVADVPQAIRNVRDAGISAELLWFIGFPTQTRKDVLDTAQFLFDHRHLFGLSAFVGDYVLHPDTEVFAHPEAFGVTIVGQTNDTCHFVVAKGLQPEESQQLKRMLACNNNRTLICNTSHLPHLVESGLDLRGLERPVTISAEVREYCAQEGPSSPGPQRVAVAI